MSPTIIIVLAIILFIMIYYYILSPMISSLSYKMQIQKRDKKLKNQEKEIKERIESERIQHEKDWYCDPQKLSNNIRKFSTNADVISWCSQLKNMDCIKITNFSIYAQKENLYDESGKCVPDSSFSVDFKSEGYPEVLNRQDWFSLSYAIYEKLGNSYEFIDAEPRAYNDTNPTIIIQKKKNTVSKNW